MPVLVALVAACALIALTISAPGSDYPAEAQPAFTALVGGDVSGFLAATPVAYAGSVILRAPGALAAAATGAGPAGVYRAGVLACLLAVALLAFSLLGATRRGGRTSAEIAVVLGLLVLSPLLLGALSAGHPEEALAGALAAGSVVAAMSGRPVIAGLALGAAVASKQWAVLAVAPVLLAAPDRRPRLCLAAGAGALVLWAPVLLADVGTFTSRSSELTGTGWIFKPQQLWWALRTEHVLPGGAVGYSGPAWLQSATHPLIVALALPLGALFWWRRDRLERHDALGLLALLLLLRCLLDPWNCEYYAVPAVLAATAWDAHRGNGLPVTGLAIAALTWVSFTGLRPYLGWDGLAAAYALWSVPLAVALAAAVYRLRVPFMPAARRLRSARPRPPHELPA